MLIHTTIGIFLYSTHVKKQCCSVFQQLNNVFTVLSCGCGIHFSFIRQEIMKHHLT